MFGPLEFLGLLRVCSLVTLRVPDVPWVEVVPPEILRGCLVFRQFRQLLPSVYPSPRVWHVKLFVEVALVCLVVKQPYETPLSPSLLARPVKDTTVHPSIDPWYPTGCHRP